MSEERKEMTIHFGDSTIPVQFTEKEEPKEIIKRILRSLRLPIDSRCGLSFMNEKGFVIKLSAFLPDNTQLAMLYNPVFVGEDGKEEVEKVPHQSLLLWLILHLHSEVPSEVLQLIKIYLNQLFKREYYCWDVENALEMHGMDTLGTSIKTSSTAWPFAATTITGVSSKNQSICWRVQFSGVPPSHVGYLRIGVLYNDEVGLLKLNPPISTLPSIAKESRSRIYDVIVQDGLLLILEVPNQVIFKGRLNTNRHPTPECPLLLAVWSKINMCVTIIKVSHQRVEFPGNVDSWPIREFFYQ